MQFSKDQFPMPNEQFLSLAAKKNIEAFKEFPLDQFLKADLSDKISLEKGRQLRSELNEAQIKIREGYREYHLSLWRKDENKIAEAQIRILEAIESARQLLTTVKQLLEGSASQTPHPELTSVQFKNDAQRVGHLNRCFALDSVSSPFEP